jgi:hypothetical protein
VDVSTAMEKCKRTYRKAPKIAEGKTNNRAPLEKAARMLHQAIRLLWSLLLSAGDLVVVASIEEVVDVVAGATSSTLLPFLPPSNGFGRRMMAQEVLMVEETIKAVVQPKVEEDD